MSDAGDWSVFWDRGASATSPPDSSNLWVGKMVGEDSDTDRANEVLGVVVIEEGAGSMEGVAYRAKLGADTVRGIDNKPPYVYDFSPAFSSTPQVALLSQAAMDTNDGSWAVLYGAAPLSATSLELAVDEDQIGDSERRHNTEQVAYLVFEEALVYPEPVVADFYATPLSGTVPLTVTLVNSSTGASSYLWDYGDNITSTASAVTHTHAYTATGVYTVSLTASGPGGSDTLTRTNYITVSPAVDITYVYDPLYRLVTATYSTGEFYHYTYDAVGNRLSLTTTVGVVNYQYDAANRLTNVNGQAYTWDDNGNLLSDGLRTYTYDHANRLTQVVSGTLTTGFTYNGAGDRVAKTVDGVTTAYVLDPAAGLTQVLQETAAGQATSYLYGLDLLAQYDSGTWAYHVDDGLGSVRQLSDPAGQVVASYSFSPFGVPLGESGGEPYGYTGEQWDASAGLVFLRARYYSPQTGRFITEDQTPGYVQVPQSLHVYVYAWNKPTLLTDPSGWQVPPEECQPGEICAGGTTGPYVVPSEPIPPAQPIEPPPTPPEPWPPIPVATPEPQTPYLPPTPDEIGQDEMLSALLQAQTCPLPTPGPAIIWGGHGDRPLHGFGQLRNFYVAASSWYRLYAEFGRGVGVCPLCAWLRAGGVYWSRMIGRIKVFENGTLLAVREEYDATGLYGDETLARAQVARELRVTTERGRRYGPFWLGSVFMGQKGSTTAERVWVDTSNGRPKEARMWLTMGAENSMPLTPFVGEYAMNLLP